MIEQLEISSDLHAEFSCGHAHGDFAEGARET